MCERQIGREIYDVAAQLRSFVEAAQIHYDRCKIASGEEEVRRQVEAGAIFALGFFELQRGMQHAAEAIACINVVRIELRGPTETDKRIGWKLAVALHVAEVEPDE